MTFLTQIEILLPELHAYSRWICSPPDDPEVLVQSAVERSLRTPGQARRPPALDMFRAVRNLHWDESRRRRVRREYFVREKRLSGVIGEMRDVSRDVSIRLAFEKLPADMREILFLVDVIGLKYSEAADVIGIAQGTVMSRVSRFRKALRMAIVGSGDDFGDAGKADETS